MTHRRQLRRPATLTAGLLAVALLSACGGEPSTTGSTQGSTADQTAGDTVEQSPTPTSPAGTDPAGTGPEGTDPADTGSADDESQTLGPGEVLTPEDAGATLRLVPGEEASLHLTPPWQDAVAEVSDPAVAELVPVDHFADPGYAEYTVVARTTGRTDVTVQQPDGASLKLTVVVEY